MISRPRIGLIGKAGSGKSSAAAALASSLDFQHCKTGKLCRDVTRLVFGDEATSHLHRVSDALQTIDEGIFLDAAIRGVDMSRPVVIDAIRFQHDIDYAMAKGFTLVRIRASAEIRSQRLKGRGQVFDPNSSPLHPIETALDGLDVEVEIENNDSLEELTASVVAVAQGPMAK